MTLSEAITATGIFNEEDTSLVEMRCQTGAAVALERLVEDKSVSEKVRT